MDKLFSKWIDHRNKPAGKSVSSRVSKIYETEEVIEKKTKAKKAKVKKNEESTEG